MLLLVDALQGKKFDNRVVQKNLARGVVSEGDLQKHLQSLPDDSSNAIWSSLEEIELTQSDKKR